jgi:hypothetical protein
MVHNIDTNAANKRTYNKTGINEPHKLKELLMLRAIAPLNAYVEVELCSQWHVRLFGP